MLYGERELPAGALRPYLKFRLIAIGILCSLPSDKKVLGFVTTLTHIVVSEKIHMDYHLLKINYFLLLKMRQQVLKA